MSPTKCYTILCVTFYYSNVNFIGIIFQRLFVKISRQLQRLLSAARSPIMSHFNESINGSSTIRAYQQQNRFIEETAHRCEEYNICHYLLISSGK